MKKAKQVNDKNKHRTRIFVINDLHFRAGTDANPEAEGAQIPNRHYYASPNNLRHFVEKVNEEKPDVALLLGDICDAPSDWALFQDIWSGIDPSVRTFFTLGNHDFDDHSFDELLSLLDNKEQPNIAGSPFNEVIELANTMIIVLDSTFDAANEHGNHYLDVHLHSETVEWLETMLLQSKHNNIFLATHVGPHLVNIDYFNAGQAEQLRRIVKQSTTSNQQVQWLFGHHHTNEITKYTNLGERNIGYLLPAMIIEENGYYTEIIVDAEGSRLRQHFLDY